MSESRVSSVIQEWVFTGQAAPHQALDPHQALEPGSSSSSSGHHAGSAQQVSQVDMMSYGQPQAPPRLSAEEQLMGLSYLPFSTSCLANSATMGLAHQQQGHANDQQVVCVCKEIHRACLRFFLPLVQQPLVFTTGNIHTHSTGQKLGLSYSTHGILKKKSKCKKNLFVHLNFRYIHL